MRYSVSINRKYQYVKVYNILKKVNENMNPVSKAAARFVDRLFSHKKGGALE